MDLFSGCGGLSLGFSTAGYDVVAGVEVDPIAARTHAINFHDGDEVHARSRSVESAPHTLWKELHLADAAPSVDVLVGGPPCQAFARIGRAKLRSESARRGGPLEDRAWLEDPRAQLYRHYLRYVRELQPWALLMENVPDVLNHGGRNLMEDVCEALDQEGYEPRYTLLNAAHYGVPQLRERMFLIAYHKDLGTTPEFPPATHHLQLPRGYEGTRNCAMRTLRDRDSEHFVGPRTSDARRRGAVSAAEALDDLPPLHAIELSRENKLRRGPRRLDRSTPYTSPSRLTSYQSLMRQWPGFESESDAVTAHEIRYLPRDYPIFREMRPGDQYPEALRIAHDLFKRKSKARGLRDDEARRQLEAETVPPYDPGKFPNKWRKMEPDAPARTLMAHLGKDSYSHIHYDSEQARTISVREAARLQSFPDGFRIEGSMNHGFRQIGNAVPPLLAYALARQIGEQIGFELKPDLRQQFGLVSRTSATAPA